MMSRARWLKAHIDAYMALEQGSRVSFIDRCCTVFSAFGGATRCTMGAATLGGGSGTRSTGRGGCVPLRANLRMLRASRALGSKAKLPLNRRGSDIPS